MNKVDLISQEESDELEKEIHSINSLANVIRSVRCQVDLSNILNCQAYDSNVKSRKFLISLRLLFMLLTLATELFFLVHC